MSTIVTPVTLLWSPVFSIFYAILTISIGRLRFMSNVSLGTSRTDGSAIIVPKDSFWYTHRTIQQQDQTSEILFKVIRIHGNFAETVSFALFFLFIAELNGAPVKLIHAGYTWLFVARISHLYGTLGKYGITLPRIFGHLSSLFIISSAGIYNFNLVKSSTKDIFSSSN